MEKYITGEKLPFLLREIGDPPQGLYCYGDETLLNTRCVAVIGSRNPTKQTYQMLAYIIPILVREGYTIVSGCAKGVDFEAHRIASEIGGRCIGVLGYGVNYRYPKVAATLIDNLCERHLIVSEYAATTAIQKYQFIARNRLIAGLSEKTIILQAKEKSGSLITAQMALEYNRDVFVLPGLPFHESYKGGHQLINEGAEILYSDEQLEKKSGLF